MAPYWKIHALFIALIDSYAVRAPTSWLDESAPGLGVSSRVEQSGLFLHSGFTPISQYTNIYTVLIY